MPIVEQVERGKRDVGRIPGEHLLDGRARVRNTRCRRHVGAERAQRFESGGPIEQPGYFTRAWNYTRQVAHSASLIQRLVRPHESAHEAAVNLGKHCVISHTSFAEESFRISGRLDTGSFHIHILEARVC